MGYYVTLTAADFVIPTANLEAAYKAMCDLNTTKHDQKRGGSWGPNVDPDNPANRWFSWMPHNYPEIHKTAAEILESLGFEVEDTDDGLSIWGYDSKTGQEDLFLEAIAPFVKDGSYIDWRGEDGSVWRLKVTNGRLEQLQGTITYGGER